MTSVFGCRCRFSFFLGLAEMLGFTTLAEYSYSEAPTNMRTLVQSLVQVSSGIGSALGMAVSPLSKDPKVLYLYTGLAATMIIGASVFRWSSADTTETTNEMTRAGWWTLGWG